LAHPFGSVGYAKEELRAEIASLMIDDRLGIGHDPGQHAAYVKSWVQVLKEDQRRSCGRHGMRIRSPDICWARRRSDCLRTWRS
jgi:antirestriction protein ArdC